MDSVVDADTKLYMYTANFEQTLSIAGFWALRTSQKENQAQLHSAACCWQRCRSGRRGVLIEDLGRGHKTGHLAVMAPDQSWTVPENDWTYPWQPVRSITMLTTLSVEELVRTDPSRIHYGRIDCQ